MLSTPSQYDEYDIYSGNPGGQIMRQSHPQTNREGFRSDDLFILEYFILIWVHKWLQMDACLKLGVFAWAVFTGCKTIARKSSHGPLKLTN
ncbi:hypothetical protein TNCV_3964651 [Trichonephila clavipes]|nr:hypothetical protein TNCV_3964651 [Trichonephila clavipes]